MSLNCPFICNQYLQYMERLENTSIWYMNATLVSVRTEVHNNVAITLAKYKADDRYAVIARYDEFINNHQLEQIKQERFDDLNRHQSIKIMAYYGGQPCEVYKDCISHKYMVLPPMPDNHWC